MTDVISKLHIEIDEIPVETLDGRTVSIRHLRPGDIVLLDEGHVLVIDQYKSNFQTVDCIAASGAIGALSWISTTSMNAHDLSETEHRRIIFFDNEDSS